MRTRHLLALGISAFCLSFAMMSAFLYVDGYIDYISASQNDPYGYGDLTLLFIKLTENFIWIIGIVNSALGAILPLSAIKKYGKGVNAACISLSAINLLLLIALVVFRFLMFEF